MMLSHLLLVFALLRSVDSFVGGVCRASSATVLRNFALKPSAIALGKREVKADRERLPAVAGLRMGDSRRRTNAFYFPREDALSTLIRKKLELPKKEDTKGLLGGSNELEKNELEDTMGQHNAIYTILWKKDEKDGLFRVADEYTLESRKQAMRRVRGDDKTFASESAKLSIPGTGPNLIAMADREQSEQIIDNPSDIWSPERRELAFTFGIKYIHFAPVPGQPGMVIEYGRASAQTSKADRQKEMESCMGRYNAVYTLLWKKDAKGVFFVQDQYTLESRKKALRRVRGDDKTFASESAKISIPGTGSNLIATADREGVEQIIDSPEQIWSPERRSLAYEFGINHIHFCPVPGQPGLVMEYGRIAGSELEVSKLLNILQEDVQKKSLKVFCLRSLKLIAEAFFLLCTVVKIHGQKNVFKGISYAVVSLLSTNEAVTDKTASGRFKLPGILVFVVDFFVAIARTAVWATRVLRGAQTTTKAVGVAATRLGSMTVGVAATRLGSMTVTRLGSMSATGLASSTAPPSPPKSSVALKRNFQ